LQAAEEAGVLGVIVGPNAEELGEFGDYHAFVILDEGSIAGWAGVSAGSAVAVGVDPVFAWAWAWAGGGWGFGGEEAGGGGTGRHWVSLPDGSG
jgi:hypothetical protein